LFKYELDDEKEEADEDDEGVEPILFTALPPTFSF
jgi:hypothetical protein